MVDGVTSITLAFQRNRRLIVGHLHVGIMVNRSSVNRATGVSSGALAFLLSLGLLALLVLLGSLVKEALAEVFHGTLVFLADFGGVCNTLPLVVTIDELLGSLKYDWLVLETFCVFV